MTTLIGAYLAGALGALIATTLSFLSPVALQRVPVVKNFGMMWMFVYIIAAPGAFIGNAVLVITLYSGPTVSDWAWLHLLVTVPVLSCIASVAFVAWWSK